MPCCRGARQPGFASAALAKAGLPRPRGLRLAAHASRQTRAQSPPETEVKSAGRRRSRAAESCPCQRRGRRPQCLHCWRTLHVLRVFCVECLVNRDFDDRGKDSFGHREWREVRALAEGCANDESRRMTRETSENVMSQCLCEHRSESCRVRLPSSGYWPNGRRDLS